VDGFEITELPLISLVYTILGGLAIARIGVHENAGKSRVLLTLVSSLLKLILGRSNACTVRSSIPWTQQSEERLEVRNSPQIAQQSYLLVTEENFAKAAGVRKVMVDA